MLETIKKVRLSSATRDVCSRALEAGLGVGNQMHEQLSRIHRANKRIGEQLLGITKELYARPVD